MTWIAERPDPILFEEPSPDGSVTGHAAVHLPPLQQALHTEPLGWSDWGLIALVAAPIFGIVEAVEWWRSRLSVIPDPSPATPGTAAHVDA